MNEKQRIMKNIAKIIQCEYCGSETDLLFHHRDPLNKSFNIGRNAGRVSIVTLMAEIEKCDILCRSCHQKIHLPGYKRKFVYPCIGYWHGLFRVRFYRDKKLCKYFKTRTEAIAFANQYALEKI